MDVTYNFTAGTRAVAQQVNQNFADVKSAIDPLQTAVAELQSDMVTKSDGSVDFTRLQSYSTYVVSNATNATPIVVTAVAHSFLTGDKVFINGVGGNTAANGTFTVTKIGVDTFSLDGSVGNGTYTNGGTCIIYPTADKHLVNKAYVTNEASKKTIGQVICVMCTANYVPDGCLPFDGAEYSFSQFPTFVSNYLTSSPSKLLTCTYTEYATSITTYGQCAKFAIDTTNQKFKAPTIKDRAFIQQASSDSELGKSYNAGLPNITGSSNASDMKLTQNYTGAFYSTGNGASSEGAGSPSNQTYTGFDASRSNSIYGASSTVQPNAVALRYFVVVANGTVNQSQMDWSNWASGMALKADKTQLDGNWTPSGVTLSNANVKGSYTIDLSSILPNDGHVYEMILNENATSTSPSSAFLSTTLFPAQLVSVCSTTNSDHRNAFPCVVNNDRKIYLQIGDSGSPNNFTSQSLNLVAYRRVS